MGFFNAINTASTGLTAQRMRMDVISNNIANASTTRTTEGGVFQRSRVLLRPRDESQVFKSHLLPTPYKVKVGSGVRVVKIEKDASPPKYVHDPTHPDAIKSGRKAGYVALPNVSIVKEMVDMISASRAYEANIATVNTSKSMFQAALNIGRSNA